MANAAIFIGWGETIPGRERQAIQVFNEAMQYWNRLQQRGEIESFEPVQLEAHGGDLSGFALLRGDREKLGRVRTSDEFMRMNTRAVLVVQHFGVVGGLIGEDLIRQYADFAAQATELS